MSRVFLGSEAVATGRVTKHSLGRSFQRILPDVYAPAGPLSVEDRILAGWLWSRRRGIVTGLSASAWHGSRWVDSSEPVELNLANNKSPQGIITRYDTIFDDEWRSVRGVPVTTVSRTAFDLARRGTRRRAIARLDALARATPIEQSEVLALAQRHPRVRGRTRVGSILAQVDPGAESPQETYLRLTLIDAGFPKPVTQIPVPRPGGRFYFLDMGWPELLIAVEYDGEHHRTSRRSFVHDVERSEFLAQAGWIVVRVLADHTAEQIIARVSRARRVRTQTVVLRETAV